MFPPIPIPSFSPETTKLLVKVGVGVGLYFVGKHLYENYQKSKGEELIKTPEGQIAQQLKNIFESFPVDGAAYRRVMQGVTTAMEEKVRDIYRLITGRFLSDDEANKISASTQEGQAKQYKINNTPGTLISIVNDQIKFNVGPGSLVRFAPGQTTPISLYLKAEDIAEGKAPVVVMPPNSKYWKVSQVKLVPLNGVKLRTDWKLIFAPVLPLLVLAQTHKEYAAVQIDISAGQGKTFVWANATDFRTQKGLSGLEQRRAITIAQADILNERFEKIKAVPRGIVIGMPVMTLNTGKAKLIQIKTIQGLIRWVNQDKILIKEL